MSTLGGGRREVTVTIYLCYTDSITCGSLDKGQFVGLTAITSVLNL